MPRRELWLSSNMFYVYILECAKGNLYIGQTTDLEKRLEKHRKNPSRQMKSKLPVKLLGSIEVETRSEAVSLEQKLKKLKSRDAVLRLLKI